ncbi:MAG: hypothetical protein M5U25_19545 [Planctomycetota bacterium]|nr:hypothetical protein [Planctomycetota bacterium]
MSRSMPGMRGISRGMSPRGISRGSMPGRGIGRQCMPSSPFASMKVSPVAVFSSRAISPWLSSCQVPGCGIMRIIGICGSRGWAARGAFWRWRCTYQLPSSAWVNSTISVSSSSSITFSIRSTSRSRSRRASWASGTLIAPTTPVITIAAMATISFCMGMASVEFVVSLFITPVAALRNANSGQFADRLV